MLYASKIAEENEIDKDSCTEKEFFEYISEHNEKFSVFWAPT
jgi:hypothetical protein